METVTLILTLEETTVNNPTCIYHLLCVLCNYMLRVLMTAMVELDRSKWSHRISYNSSMLEYKVNKFPPWLFSTTSNTAIVRKIHAPDSHQWKPLPWLCLLRQRPWTIQETAVEWRWSDSWSDSGATSGALAKLDGTTKSSTIAQC